MKNAFIAKAVQSLKRRTITFFYRIRPLKKVILFESLPDFQDSSRAVFDEMIKRGVNKQYKLVWVLKNGYDNYPMYENVEYVSFDDKKFRDYNNLAILKFSCNTPLLPLRKKQISFNLWHGSPIKAVKWLVESNGWTLYKFTYFLAASEQMIPILSDEFNVPTSKFVALGMPRNDEMTKKETDLHTAFGVDYQKLVVWYPTFRQGINSSMDSLSDDALPIIHNADLAEDLNSFLKEKGILLVIKPHFAQVLDNFKALDLDHIIFIYDDFFAKNNVTSYQLVASGDAFLTDYSSIYYDYTLRDKPIGLVWEDIEEYRRRPGFIQSADFDFITQGGIKIYNINDLKKFLDDVSCGIDGLRNERRAVRDFANISTDGNNTQRVVDFALTRINYQ